MNKEVFNTASHFHTPLGEIIGQCEDEMITIKGIPYAKANRFSLPTMIEQLDNPFIADKSCPACPQDGDPYFDRILGGNSIADLMQDENCQRLSIYRPLKQFNTKLPVMVWIHGGGYISGAGDATTSNPMPFIKEQNVIVVNVNYRLGIFGFFGGYLDRPANLGLFDLITALQWIKKYITFFGGDADNVTLFGQSAGGDAVAQLMISDGTKGLFHKAIIQSAPFGILFGKKEMHTKMKQIAKKARTEDSPERLLKLQNKMFQAAQGYGLKSGMPFGVQYGYAPLPKESEAMKQWQKRARECELIIGYTQDETAVFVPQLKDLDGIWTKPWIGELLKKLFIKVSTKKLYGRSAHKFAENYRRGGGKVWEYQLVCDPKRNKLGATHTIDLPLLFGLKETWKEAELLENIHWKEIEHQGKRIRKIWANFARDGHKQIDDRKTHKIKLW